VILLAINTASKESAIALIESGIVLGEDSWGAAANETEKLLPNLQALLQKGKKKWQDLEGIFVTKGPGAYTSLRVGIAVANSAAWVLKLPMFSADVFEVWEKRLTLDRQIAPHAIVVDIGRGNYRLTGDTHSYSLEELIDLGKPCYGELPDDFKTKAEVDFSFGQGVANFDFWKLSKEKMIQPLYSNPPNITLKK